MSMNYRLADMLSLIRNGQAARLAVVRCQATNLLGNVLEVLKHEGFIAGYKSSENDGKPEFEMTARAIRSEAARFFLRFPSVSSS